MISTKGSNKPSVLLLIGALFFLLLPESSASVPRKRILVLFPYESHTPEFISFDASFRSTLTGFKDREFEFFLECMDLTRFPDERYHDGLMNLYREKYSGLKIDLIVAVLRSSFDFLTEYGDEFFRETPVILYDQDPRLLGDRASVPNATVVPAELNLEGTLALALRLHPGARHVFVVSGASRYDQSLETMVREALGGFENQVALHYLSGLPMDELIRQVSSLPEHSVMFYLSISRDGNGTPYKSPEALALISKQANAPIYSVSESYMGSGIVGGQLISHSAQGARIARVALHVLFGQEPDSLDASAGSGNQFIFDARELKRWGINESSLPPGSVVRYKDFSIWQAYRWRIIGVASILIIQAFLIYALAISLRRQRRARDATRASEEFTRAVLASLKNQVAILDRNGTVLAVNEAWEDSAVQNDVASLAGLSPGVNYLEVCRSSSRVRDDLASRALEGIQLVLNGEREDFSLEYPCNTPSDHRWFLMKVMPFKNPGGGVVVSHTDVTERKNAELEALRRNEELAHITRVVTVGELATSLAHEINQPLTAIRCNAEAAQRFLSSAAPDMEEVRQILQDIINDDTRAGEVIRRMRTLVKKESPRQDAVDLNGAIRETIALIQGTPLLDGLVIMAELDHDLPPARGDRVQLQQVTLNLLMNAVDAMRDAPPVSRKVTVRTTMRDSNSAVVSVADSGKGLDESDMGQVFEPFYSTKADGLGMGLSISRNIIKAHGGEIWAKNNREGGATFSFALPLDGGDQL